MMLKKIVLGVSLASAAMVAQAQYTNSGNCDFFSGPYIGADAFYLSTNDKITVNSTDKIGRNVDLYAGHDGWGGGLFAGFGKVMDRTYVGAELYGRASTGKQKLISSGDDYYAAVKSPYTYGAMAKLGYLTSPQSLVYIGLGAENSQFKFIDGLTGADHDINKVNRWAFVPSVGMDLALNCNWQIGARFSYANYRDIDQTVNVLDRSISGTFSPRRATFALNVTYHFV